MMMIFEVMNIENIKHDVFKCHHDGPTGGCYSFAAYASLMMTDIRYSDCLLFPRETVD